MLITWVWVGVGLVGVGFALLVLREVLADQRAAEGQPISPAARLFLHETVRTTAFGLGALALLAGAGVPALLPFSRPGWVRLLVVGSLIAGEALLTLDMMFRLRAKRRMLARLRRDRKGV